MATTKTRAVNKAINKDKELRTLLRDRSTRARQHMRDERAALTQKISEIRLACEGAPAIAMDRLRQRFLEVGRNLDANLDPDTQLFDDRFKKRVTRTSQAGCRLKQREARVDAEPGLRAGKAAYAGNRNTQKEAQKAAALERRRNKEVNARIPHGAKRKEAEEEVLHELGQDETTAQLIPIWKRVRPAMFKRAAESGKLSPYEAFLQYVEENFADVKAEIDKIQQQSDKKLARAQAAHAKRQARESGQSVPSEAYRVPGSRRAPDSGVRPSRRVQDTEHAGPTTVMSARGTAR